jgi:hypothetical protein
MALDASLLRQHHDKMRAANDLQMIHALHAAAANQHGAAYCRTNCADMPRLFAAALPLHLLRLDRASLVDSLVSDLWKAPRLLAAAGG